jgi:hypothetical protein
MSRPDFLNFKVDHMTLLLRPEMYNVSYLIFRTIFGCTPDHMLYEKRKEWQPGEGDKSLTFAMNVGGGGKKEDAAFDTTMIAIVQPTEPSTMGSHVRDMLDGHGLAAHWQHIALRTPDLFAFYQHASERGVNFITPLLHDESDDVIQVFSGEWFYPGAKPSGMFFEFLQRNPSPDLLKKLAERNRESWFNDKTFLGLYGEKEREYRDNSVTPFLDPQLFESLREIVKSKQLWEIKESDVQKAEDTMKAYQKARTKS